MGNKIYFKNFYLSTMRAVSVIVVLVIFSQMNALKLPKQLCSPLKNIGTKVATDVLKCATSSGPLAKAKAVEGKAASMAAKVGLKVKLPSEKDMAAKMVSALASKVGCRRRMFGLKNIAKAVKHAAKNVAKKAKTVVKKVGDSAIKMACKSFGSMCPKACDAGVNKITPMMKNYKIPTKCFDKVAKDTCHQACVEICKGK